MDAYLSISEYGSLNFDNRWRQREQQCAKYTQRFVVGDTVTVQYAIPKGENQSWDRIDIRQYDADGMYIPVTTSVVLNTDEYVHYNAIIDTSAAGCFRVVFVLTSGGSAKEIKGCVFEAVAADDPRADDLLLFQYNNEKNKDNTVFVAPFCFRCSAKFFPQNENYGIENNDFRDQDFDLSLLSAEAYSSYGLTVGDQYGVPTWVGRKLNYIFSCTEVLLGEIEDSIEFVRSDGATVERTNLGEMNPLYIFHLNLERTVSGFDGVKIGNVTPIVKYPVTFTVRVSESAEGDSLFQIDRHSVELAYDNVSEQSVGVSCPDNSWTLAVNSDWLTAEKVSNTRAVFSATQNDGEADRTQSVVFSWTNPTTGNVVTRTLVVTQLTDTESLGTIMIYGRVLDEQGNAAAGATVSLYNSDGGEVIAITSSDSNGGYVFEWDIPEPAWDASDTVIVTAVKAGYAEESTSLDVKPSYEDAVANGIIMPDIQLALTEPKYPIEFIVNVNESDVDASLFTLGKSALSFADGNRCYEFVDVYCPDKTWTVEPVGDAASYVTVRAYPDDRKMQVVYEGGSPPTTTPYTVNFIASWNGVQRPITVTVGNSNFYLTDSNSNRVLRITLPTTGGSTQVRVVCPDSYRATDNRDILLPVDQSYFTMTKSGDVITITAKPTSNTNTTYLYATRGGTLFDDTGEVRWLAIVTQY